MSGWNEMIYRTTCMCRIEKTYDPSVTLLVVEQEAKIIHRPKHSWYWAEETASRCHSSSQRHTDMERMQDWQQLTSSVDKVGFCFRRRRWQQVFIILIRAERAWVVPPPCIHYTVGHHYVAERVVKVTVQQTALVFRWWHVVIRQWGVCSGSKTRTHSATFLLDDALVHWLAELPDLGPCCWVTIWMWCRIHANMSIHIWEDISKRKRTEL